MKQLIRGALMGCVVATLLSALFLHSGAEAKAKIPVSGAGCAGCDYLYGVAALSANDVWGVGYYVNKKGVTKTLIEQWNGTTWSVIKSPNPGSLGNYLYGVAAVSATDIWAVGFYNNIGDTTGGTLIEHWNGTTWSVVKNPTSTSFTSQLQGIAAVSATDVWAVGTNSSSGTLIEHWNGTKWSVVKSPKLSAATSILLGVAVSANTVWAVGYYNDANFNTHTLIEQWNGTSWRVISSPSPSSSFNSLSSVAALSASDVWAVGTYEGANYDNYTLIEQWNGSSWSVVSSPSPGPSGSGFSAVAAVSVTDVWAGGATTNYQGTPPNLTLVEQWNGSGWSVVSSPSRGSNGSLLQGITVVSASDIWAVGFNTANGTLIEQWNGTTWSVVSSPSPS